MEGARSVREVFLCFFLSFIDWLTRALRYLMSFREEIGSCRVGFGLRVQECDRVTCRVRCLGEGRAMELSLQAVISLAFPLFP